MRQYTWTVQIGRIVAMLSVPAAIWGQSPTFEAASIKLNTGCPVPGKAVPTPGRVSLKCATLESLVQAAYGMFADGVGRKPQVLEVVGGPNWMKSDFYDVNAKADGNPRIEQMVGPMMQALLEERFKLKVHRAAKEVPVYELVLAKGGPKFQRTKEGSCVTVDLNHMPQPTPGEPFPTYCGSQTMQRKGPAMVMFAHGMTMEGLAGERLPRMAGRPVIDKSGLTGMFDFQLEFALETREFQTREGDPPSAPDIFAALQQQLGLKLEPAKGSVDLLVIDHAERPMEN
jgi:uncharacterized protein (TIGR03435 family)